MKKVTLALLVVLALGIGFFQVPAGAALEYPLPGFDGWPIAAPPPGPRLQSLGEGALAPGDIPGPGQTEGQDGPPPATPTPAPPDEPGPSRRPQVPQSTPPTQGQVYDSLHQKAQQRGTVRVIVGLDASFSPEGGLSTPAADRQRSDIAQAQQRTLDRVRQGQISLVTRFKFIPYMVVEVDDLALESLMEQSGVIGLQEDVPDKISLPGNVPAGQEEPDSPFLSNTISVIGANNVFNDGFTGSGQTIAILDTGVDKTHTFLSSKVVSEACFSTTSAPAFSTTVCPNGLAEDLSSGSGVNCPLSINGCDHGTHVAGIAAGKGGSSTGVAKDANIIAIQVFSSIDDAGFCPGSTPCTGSFTSDQISGLERVFDLRNTFNIASVNMSLGGGSFSSVCDSDSRKAAVDNLRSAGIVTVAAAGNDAITGGISTPACISTVVSVGATNNSDLVASFSNCASIMDLWGPGVGVTSSVPGGGFSAFNGTSMASPHIAGAWALARSKSPKSTVTDILSAFTSQGVSVVDTLFGCPTKPRIQVDSALDTCIPTGSGDWAIPQDLTCVLPANATITGNLTLGQDSTLTVNSGQTLTVTGNTTLETNSTLTIQSAAVLDLNLATNHLRIKSGAAARVQNGGKID